MDGSVLMYQLDVTPYVLLLLMILGFRIPDKSGRMDSSCSSNEPRRAAMQIVGFYGGR